MLTLSSVLKGSDLLENLHDSKRGYLKARAEYELALRRFTLDKVENCPSCFKNFYDSMKDRVKSEAFYSDFEPKELDILEEMFITPIVHSHKDKLDKDSTE